MNDSRRVADELEIRNLVARLSQLADTVSDEDLDTYLDLFTDDATWVVAAASNALPSQQRRGREEIRAGALERRAAGIQGPGSDSRHVVSTLVVSFDSDDQAMARCYWQYYTATSSNAPVLALMGEYLNTFVRTVDGWKLARRELLPG